MSAQEIDEQIRRERETVSQCYTSFTRQGGNVYPESETEQALRAENALLEQLAITQSQNLEQKTGAINQLNDDWYAEHKRNTELTSENAALKAQLAAAIYALEGVVPINGRGECAYCGMGSKPNARGYHFDRDNIWDGDKLCYNSDYYDDARAVLKGAK